jgi:hypothetical protein
MVKTNLHALYSDLTLVYKLIMSCIRQQQSGIRRRITVDRYFNSSRMYMWDHTVEQTKSRFCIHQVTIFQLFFLFP